ncbi:MAG: hypothetical protein KDE56_27095 [Anaerolineales bacterium]|nr:hypothetical protein [Anaerolineales bacterium]MCA9999471.1 hypothetical protein [Anaerolineales bacterium]
MAPTAITPVEVAGPYISEAVAQLTTPTWTAGDATNGNKVTIPNRRILLLFRNDNVAAQYVTIASSNDPYGRTAPITQLDIAAGAYAARFFEPVGWEQTLGGRDLLITPESTDINILAIPV